MPPVGLEPTPLVTARGPRNPGPVPIPTSATGARGWKGRRPAPPCRPTAAASGRRSRASYRPEGERNELRRFHMSLLGSRGLGRLGRSQPALLSRPGPSRAPTTLREGPSANLREPFKGVNRFLGAICSPQIVQLINWLCISPTNQKKREKRRLGNRLKSRSAFGPLVSRRQCVHSLKLVMPPPTTRTTSRRGRHISRRGLGRRGNRGHRLCARRYSKLRFCVSCRCGICSCDRIRVLANASAIRTLLGQEIPRRKACASHSRTLRE